MTPAARLALALWLASAMFARAYADDAVASGEAAEASSARGDSDASTTPETFALHGQLTNVTQGHRKFASPYSGANSLLPDGRTEQTTDLTLYVGQRLWSGGELWLNPEVDHGFGLSNTLGVAGFTNGEAYKVGSNQAYLRLPRAFVRQVVALGNETNPIESAANQLADSRPVDNVTLTLGKFSVVDVFDLNTYAHDPRADFLNWSIIDAGVFDYAADPWGYTYGASVEWTQDWWTLRGGVFQLSGLPNSKIVAVDFSQNMLVAEGEERHRWNGHPGKLKLLAFVNHARMASYSDALRLAASTGEIPDVALVRVPSSKAGIALNFEQEITTEVGTFARASANNGSKETYEFTDINKSLSLGLSIKGTQWGRPKDTVGIAGVVNKISKDAQKYFAAGGLGILVGDGRLTYAPERLVEIYYAAHFEPVTVTLDYQYIRNPAYNQDRGPVSIFGFRFHAEF